MPQQSRVALGSSYPNFFRAHLYRFRAHLLSCTPLSLGEGGVFVGGKANVSLLPGAELL